MFKRKIEEELKIWKENLSIKKKAFILKGLRQIGKTTSILKFANENYENVIYINFKLEQSLKLCFDGDLSVDKLITNISSSKSNCKFIANKTVLIFDEIQECFGARASIKSFMLDGRFDIIASGSLLGIKGYNQKYSGGIPVGFEHTVYMKPMDFEEFLWAKGIDDKVISYLKTCFNNKEQISSAVHQSMLRYFKEYLCVGGMPSVVDIFLKTNDLNQVRQEQKDILESYKDDYGKHLNENENEILDKSLLLRINKVFDSIPSQLAKENKKFVYSKLSNKATSNQYEPAIQWLCDYGLINRCYNLSCLELPLEGNKIDKIFKIYIADTGLFVSMLDEDTSYDILLGDMGIYKGAIYENIIADTFSKLNKPLYYFSKDSGLEIDFITKYNKELYLIEVKSTNGNTKSSKTVLSDNIKYPYANNLIKLGECNIGQKENILTIPYYLAFLLK